MKWTSILSIIGIILAVLIGLILIFWFWINGTFSKWADHVQYSMIEMDGRPSFYFYRNRWSDEVYFQRSQGDGLGRHSVKYPLKGVTAKKFELKKFEIAGPEGPVSVLIGVTPEKDFYEDFALPFKVSQEPLVKVSNHLWGDPTFFTAQHIYVRNRFDWRFDVVPVNIQEFRFIPPEGGEMGTEACYIADSQRVFYVNSRGQLSEVKTAKPADFRSDQRYVAMRLVATDGVQRFHEGQAVSDEELARIEREFSPAQVVVEETYSGGAAPTEASPPPNSSGDASRGMIRLEVGASHVFENQLRLTLVEIRSKSHAPSGEGISAPVSSAEVLQVLVEHDGAKETLYFQKSFAGFPQQDTDEWNGYRIRLEQIVYEGSMATAVFRVSRAP